MQIKKQGCLKLAGLCFSLLGLVSCATEQKYATEVKSWQGAPESALVKSWGSPQEVNTMANGNHVLMYRSIERETLPKTYAPDTSMTGRLTTQTNNTVMLGRPPTVVRDGDASFWCETEFEVNNHNLIVNASFHGTNCATTQMGVERRSLGH
ncbi:MAG: hypothetical protein NTU49_06940 [Gammaproteobacteria bacterium]|nr:hypothetical protein [Gammaproteobacteria bacterium]